MPHRFSNMCFEFMERLGRRKLDLMVLREVDRKSVAAEFEVATNGALDGVSSH